MSVGKNKTVFSLFSSSVKKTKNVSILLQNTPDQEAMQKYFNEAGFGVQVF